MMLPLYCEKICKTCQYCLESFYWNCCEEKFCFDKKIASYQFNDERDGQHDNSWPHVYNNIGASVDSVVTSQPVNNNNLPSFNDTRIINDLPVHVDKIYEVFSKSMIFRDDQESNNDDMQHYDDDFETKSEPDSYDKPSRTVIFEDELDNPITDFEIMFRDELLKKRMSTIGEEIDDFDFDDDVSPEDNDKDGIFINIDSKNDKEDMIQSNVTLKDQNKITTQKPVYQYDPNSVLNQIPPHPNIPRNEIVKSILRVGSQRELTRSASARNILERNDSNAKLKLSRVDSLKNIHVKNIDKVLQRVPQRSASFLNIPEHLLPQKPLLKSKSVLVLHSTSQISKMPDTPIIKSSNLPKFFEDPPSIPEFKKEVTLQSIKMESEARIKEREDLGMPRYYRSSMPNSPVPVHESKSMPDLSMQSAAKVSKRLVKLRTKLKPLVIKKSEEF